MILEAIAAAAARAAAAAAGFIPPDACPAGEVADEKSPLVAWPWLLIAKALALAIRAAASASTRGSIVGVGATGVGVADIGAIRVGALASLTADINAVTPKARQRGVVQKDNAADV